MREFGSRDRSVGTIRVSIHSQGVVCIFRERCKTSFVILLPHDLSDSHFGVSWGVFVTAGSEIPAVPGSWNSFVLPRFDSCFDRLVQTEEFSIRRDWISR